MPLLEEPKSFYDSLALSSNSFSSIFGSFYTFCFLIGFFWLSKRLYRIIKQVYIEAFRPEKDLRERYGPGSYALVTGSSDGIGKAFCFSLAKRGFNIILAARSQAKLQGVEKELKARYPLIQVKTIVADFSESYKDGFFNKIVQEIKDLDVSVLVNNVGIGYTRYLTELSESELKETVAVNCLPQIVLSKYLMEKFLSRGKRSCIITVSSISVDYLLEAHQVYGATKAFNDHFSRTIALEYPQVDCISVKPALVDTNMTKSYKKRYLPISPEECAEATLRKVGYEDCTYGHWKHLLLSEITKLVPKEVRKNAGSKKLFTEGKKNH